MKKIILTAIILVLAVSASADVPENGIYHCAQAENGKMIIAVGGKEVYFGDDGRLDIMDAMISAQDNANTNFYLALDIPYDTTIECAAYVLVVDGTAYLQGGYGSSENISSSINFHVPGQERAEQVAEYFAIPLLLRRHPGHQFLVSFVPDKESFTVGEDVMVTLQITNIGSDTIAFMKGGRNRAARDNQYIFSAERNYEQVEDIGSSMHMGGMAFSKKLVPGEMFEDSISLKKWFAFAEPGMYAVHGSYYLAFQDPEDDTWRTLWEDHVAADFYVRVDEIQNQ